MLYTPYGQGINGSSLAWICESLIPDLVSIAHGIAMLYVDNVNLCSGTAINEYININ